MDIEKSSEMPEPQVMNYLQFYKVTNLFINDLKKVLADVPYVEAKKFFDKIEENNKIFPIACLNEFIRDIGQLPFSVVNNIMTVINNKDNFVKYFSPYKPTKEEFSQFVNTEIK